jgi:DNA polymerase III subunit gamma/tau
VDDIRSLVDQVRFAPQAGKYKVYIIDEVHMLTASAFNAFLKTLEEPPPYAIFILATTEKHKILPTILSRCQIFDFKRITANDTVAHLEEICEKETIHADKAALHIIAQKSEGCMRDALSILDKIVSFTNGEVQYENTLEHLNILDAGYYFKLLDSMQQQDLAGAMLLYDDINSKGFEGDLVIEGFTEFLRNLLVCKDEKVAHLLEAVESFKDKYIAAAKKTEASYIISALNILNDTGIQYKAARNKRLHVELAIIKLAYLQQAIEITSTGDGITKKKIVDAARPVAFRSLGITPVKETTAPAAKAPAAKLTIETPAATSAPLPIKTTTATTPPPTTFNGGGKLGALNKIRQQYAGATAAAVAAAIPLSMGTLQKAWDEYTAMLKEQKSPSEKSFEMAVLRIINDGAFEAMSATNLQCKFIDQERLKLGEFLQERFCNRQLTFAITQQEQVGNTQQVDLPLNNKQQYQKIAEQYPLVKELKDKLRLDLDYM